MNTWRDIKEAPLNEAVFATDGDMVFFGRFAMTADRKCMFEGQDIEEACNYGIDPACLTGWQPIPDTWKPEKSADEMFRELGYERVDETSSADASIMEVEYYRKRDRSKIIVDRFQAMRIIAGRRVSLFYGELLACAQLIREMEVNNG